MTEAEVILRPDDGVGRITLNRPKALNSLTLGMCRDITNALLDWEADPAIVAVQIDHSGGRGFCAGGDIRLLYEALKAGSPDVVEFFRTEYRMNHLLFTLGKPVTCIMDGIVMGGGAGVAMPCRYRVATEMTLYAMPEVGIGLFPDVGGGWFLSRLPGRIGEWLALTGSRLDGRECLALGLATHYVPQEELEGLRADALPPQSPQPASRLSKAIDRLFAADRIEDIIAALESDTSAWAQTQLAEIGKKAPLSCKVALRQLSEARKLSSFAENMAMEYRIVTRLIGRPDILEGVRAFIIDRDNDPAWSPPRFENVSDKDVDAIFERLPPGEEWTPLGRD